MGIKRTFSDGTYGEKEKFNKKRKAMATKTTSLLQRSAPNASNLLEGRWTLVSHDDKFEGCCCPVLYIQMHTK